MEIKAQTGSKISRTNKGRHLILV